MIMTQNKMRRRDLSRKTQGDFKICRVYENNALLVFSAEKFF